MRRTDESRLVRKKFQRLENSQLHIIDYTLNVYFNGLESVNDQSGKFKEFSKEGIKLLREQNFEMPQGKLLIEDIRKILNSEIKRRKP